MMSTGLALGPWLAVFVLAAAPPPSPRPAVPAYTNDDLDRVSGRRGETGVLSQPAAPPPSSSGPPGPEPARRGEDYWRRQAERLRERLEPLQQRARELRERIEDRRRDPRVRPYTDDKVVAWQRRLAETEARIRDLEGRFEDQARREGALPGWLR